MLLASVGFLLRLPVVRALHERQLLFPSVLLIIVAGVLVQGALERNKGGGESGNGVDTLVPVTPPRPIVRADLEKTPLTYFSDYWNQLGGGLGNNFVTVGPTATPAILIGSNLALTSSRAAEAVLEEVNRSRLTSEDSNTKDPEAVSVAANEIDGEGSAQVVDLIESTVEEPLPYGLQAWDDELGLALFETNSGGGGGFTLTDSGGLLSGSYIAAVTLDTSGEPTVTPGYFVGELANADQVAGDLVIAMDLPATLSVAAIVDLDGAMVGVAYTSQEGLRVVSARAMLGLVDLLQVETLCRSIEVANLDDLVKQKLEMETGVLVEYVRLESFAQEPSLRAGDILLEWGNTSLESAEQFSSLYDAQVPGSLVRYRVLRGSRRVTGGTIMPASNCEPSVSEPVRLPKFGLAVQWMGGTESGGEDPSSGWQVVAVAPGGPAERVGIEQLDRLRSIDGRLLGDEDDRPRIETASASDEPLVISLVRESRAKLVAVSPNVSDENDVELDGSPE